MRGAEAVISNQRALKNSTDMKQLNDIGIKNINTSSVLGVKNWACRTIKSFLIPLLLTKNGAK